MVGDSVIVEVECAKLCINFKVLPASPAAASAAAAAANSIYNCHMMAMI